MDPTQRDLAIRTIIGEAANQSPKGQRAVASVILNRLRSGKYGSTVSDVVLAPHQFETWDTNPDLLNIAETSPEYQAAASAFDTAEQGADPTGGAVNYYNPTLQAEMGRSRPSWATGDGQQIGDHVFYGGDPQAAATDDIFRQFDQALPAPGAPATSDPSAVFNQFEQAFPAAPTKPWGTTIHEAKQGIPAGEAGMMLGEGAKQGILDVAETGANLGQVISRATTGGNENPALTAAQRWLQQHRQEFAVRHANDPAAMDMQVPFIGRVNPSVSSLGRFGGEMLAAAPVMGAGGKLLSAAGDVATKAVPALRPATEFLSGAGGQNLLTKAASRAVPGAAGGAAAAGLVSGANPDMSVKDQMITGAAIGAGVTMVGPALAALGAGGARAVGRWVHDIATGSEAGTTKVVAAAEDLTRRAIDNTGMSIPEIKARAAANPDFTLADASPGMRDLAGATAAQGGRATDVLKGALEKRAAEADQKMLATFDQELGPKPDITQAVTDIQQRASAGYEKWKAVAQSTAQPIKMGPVVRMIDKMRTGAVGEKAAALDEIRGNIVHEGFSKAAGKEVYKSELDHIHQIRQGIDDQINVALRQGKNNLAQTLGQVRDKIDARLKSNPAMRRADELYSGEMAVKEGVDTGQHFFDAKVDPMDAARQFNAAKPDVQDAILLGARHAIARILEGGQGEARNAIRVFGKGEETALKQKLRTLYGPDTSDRIFNAIRERMEFARTESNVAANSQTANKFMSSKLLEEGVGSVAKKPGAGGMSAADMVPYLMMDPASATLAAGARHAGAHWWQRRATAKYEKALKDVSGQMADILSLSGQRLVRFLDRLEATTPRNAPRSRNKLLNAAGAAGALGFNPPSQSTSVPPQVSGNRLLGISP